MFNLRSSINSDECAILAEDTHNRRINEYMLFSQYAQCTNEYDQVKEFSYKNGANNSNTSLPSCEITNDSNLRLGETTHMRGRQQLCSQTFTGAPMIGRGVVSPEIEDRLVQGELRQPRKGCYNESQMDNFTPLLPCLREHVIMPVVPTLSRSGEPTRDIDFQQKFLKESGYEFDGKIWHRKYCDNVKK